VKTKLRLVEDEGPGGCGIEEIAKYLSSRGGEKPTKRSPVNEEIAAPVLSEDEGP